MHHRALAGAALILAAAAAVPARAADVVTVRLDAAAAAAPMTGRLILFFATEAGTRSQRRTPMRGPFFDPPQPIASIAVTDLAPGASIDVDLARAVTFPDDLATLDGPVWIQAVLDADQTERDHARGPGNPYSTVVEATLRADADDRVEIALTKVVGEPRMPPETENLRWVELDSPSLGAFYGRSVKHRAGVALPRAWSDPEQADRRWPALYVIPGYGGTQRGAVTWARVLATPEADDLAPQAVIIVLDPESPLGHHGFTDGPNHGPRGTALVTELIPYLESRFRLDPRPAARLVTGHSSGGWSSLWLQLQHPDVFGACWASAPDPVDFHAFQMTDLYEDASMFTGPDGAPTPSYREQVDFGVERVEMTVRQEARMERAVHPGGASGQQWDAWEAMFSPRDPETGLPVPMFDDGTGAIDHDVVESSWSRYDVARLVREDWDRYGPILTGRVRLACGTLDNFYLNRAVARLKSIVDERAPDHAGPGYIWLVEDATHGNLEVSTFQRWNAEMRAFIEQGGPAPPASGEGD